MSSQGDQTSPKTPGPQTNSFIWQGRVIGLLEDIAKQLGGGKPIHMKVKKEYLSEDILKELNIPYKEDSRNPDYFIITQYMPVEALDVIFELSRTRLAAATRVEPPQDDGNQVIIDDGGDGAPTDGPAHDAQRPSSPVESGNDQGEETKQENSRHGSIEASIRTPFGEASDLEKGINPPSIVQELDTEATDLQGKVNLDDSIVKKHSPRTSVVIGESEKPFLYHPTKITEIMRGKMRADAEIFTASDTMTGHELDEQITRFTWSQKTRHQAKFQSFETFQMLNLYRKQHKLAKILESLGKKSYFAEKAGGDWMFTDSDESSWGEAEELLQEYLSALKDLQWTKSLRRLSFAESEKHTRELMKRFSLSAYLSPLVFDKNPYVDVQPQSKSPDPFRKLLATILPRRVTANDSQQQIWYKQFRQLGISVSDQAEHEVPVSYENIDGTARLLMALFGGALLMAPIIAMSFADTQNLRLIIASVFVLVFSVILSFATTASNQEVIGGAAAYAAVIVVFVGSALSSTSLD